MPNFALLRNITCSLHANESEKRCSLQVEKLAQNKLQNLTTLPVFSMDTK